MYSRLDRGYTVSITLTLSNFMLKFYVKLRGFRVIKMLILSYRWIIMHFARNTTLPLLIIAENRMYRIVKSPISYFCIS